MEILSHGVVPPPKYLFGIHKVLKLLYWKNTAKLIQEASRENYETGT
jgi:hypothetical protein